MKTNTDYWWNVADESLAIPLSHCQSHGLTRVRIWVSAVLKHAIRALPQRTKFVSGRKKKHRFGKNRVWLCHMYHIWETLAFSNISIPGLFRDTVTCGSYSVDTQWKDVCKKHYEIKFDSKNPRHSEKTLSQNLNVHPHPSRPALEPTQRPVKWILGVSGIFPGRKEPGRSVDLPPPSSAEVKERVKVPTIWGFMVCSKVTFL